MKKHATLDLENLFLEVLKTPLIKSRKGVQKMPEFVAYLFYVLYQRCGDGGMEACRSSLSSNHFFLVFNLGEAYGKGWCRCWYDQIADAYDLEYGQDKDQKKPLISVFSGHYLNGVRQANPRFGTRPDIYFSAAPEKGSILNGIQKVFFADEVKLVIDKELRAFRPIAVVLPTPTYEYVDQ